MAASNKREAKEQAEKAVDSWAKGFAAVAWIPGSSYVMGAGDLTMIIQLGSIYNVDLDKTGAAAVFGTVAAPLIGSKIANSVLDFVPVVGWLAKSGVAYGVTKGVGKALISYFSDCSSLID